MAGYKLKISLWHFNGFPDGINLGTTNSIMLGRSPPFLTFSVLVANPREILETVANPARGLLNTDYGDTTVSEKSERI